MQGRLASRCPGGQSKESIRSDQGLTATGVGVGPGRTSGKRVSVKDQASAQRRVWP